MSMYYFPDSLTREEGFVNQVVKQLSQMVALGSPESPYLNNSPFFSSRASQLTPQFFEIGLSIAASV
jgi:hypothetical protein